jgi:hypothetical protein
MGSGVVARESRAGVAFRGVGTGRFGGEAAGASFDRVPEDILVESKSQRCKNSPSALWLGKVGVVLTTSPRECVWVKVTRQATVRLLKVGGGVRWQRAARWLWIRANSRAARGWEICC